MSIAYLCILIAAALPYVWVGYAKFSKKGYNNSAPREYLQTLEGKGKRAHYAHLNAFEAFPAFAAAVIVAQLTGVSAYIINNLSAVFIVCRILHGICYIKDLSSLRSLVWVGGFGCVIALYILAICKSSF